MRQAVEIAADVDVFTSNVILSEKIDIVQEEEGQIGNECDEDAPAKSSA